MTPAIEQARNAGIVHQIHQYEHDASEAYGEEAARKLGLDAGRVFKTLIAQVDGARLVVGIVPVATLLNLKALAAAAGGKRAEMADLAAAEKTTGYVAGGISPLGQRKKLTTVLDESAMQWPTIYVSAGRRGLEIELAPADLVKLCGAMIAPIGRNA